MMGWFMGGWVIGVCEGVGCDCWGGFSVLSYWIMCICIFSRRLL